jgi:hypothetical protein
MQLRRNRIVGWSLLVAALALAFFAFGYPMYVIRPFRTQGPNELALALIVKRWSTVLGGCAVVAALACCVLLWRIAPRLRSRVLVVAAGSITILFAFLTHINVYEKMFHRIDTPQSTAAKDAKLDQDDMVLAIRVAEHARAYPIRMMGYHHIVNDRLGVTPVVATY